MPPAVFPASPAGPASPLGATDAMIRSSEVLAALSHALDLTDGNPSGHTLRACLIGMRLGREIGLGEGDLTALYYALLLKDAGCSSNAARTAALFGAADQRVKYGMRFTDWHRRLPLALATARNAGAGGGLRARVAHFVRIARTPEVTKGLIQIRCDRGAEIVRALGFPEATAAAVRSLDEHWDGGGYPDGLSGEAISPLARIANLAQAVEIFFSASGEPAALRVARARRGTWFEPRLVDQLLTWRGDRAWWEALREPDVHARAVAAEPDHPSRPLDAAGLDDICRAFASMIDAKSPFTFQHSSNVADYATAIAEVLGCDASERHRLYRAGLLHDIGKLGVSSRILDKPGALTPAERLEIQRHAAFSWQILARVAAFRQFAWTAVLHHERLDGGGYPWGFLAPQLDRGARILCVADVYEALTADRPYRAGMPPEAAFALLARDAGTGLCGDVVEGLREVMRGRA